MDHLIQVVNGLLHSVKNCINDFPRVDQLIMLLHVDSSELSYCMVSVYVYR